MGDYQRFGVEGEEGESLMASFGGAFLEGDGELWGLSW